MPVNNELRNLARDGRFSLEDARTVQRLVQSGQVSAAEAREALERYGDVMDADAGRLMESFTGGTRPAATNSMPGGTLARTLEPRSSGDDVRALQRGLMAIGMREQNPAFTLPSGVDSNYGGETTSAVRAFQASRGLPATGVADPATLRALDQALRSSSSSSVPQQQVGSGGATTARPVRGLGGAGQTEAWQNGARGGDESIRTRMTSHQNRIDQTGIGDYYGDHGPFAEAVRRGDRAEVARQIQEMSGGRMQLDSMTRTSVTVRDQNGVTRTMRESSCIGWVMENVRQAYAAAGKQARFAEIEQRMRAGGMRGTILCEELQKDGWTSVFYSPRTAQDLKDSGQNEKLAALRMAQNGQRIWRSPVEGSQGVRPDAVVTGYRDTTPDARTEELLQRLERAPFFVGVANGGTHTFVGHNGSVNDFHWTAGPDNRDAMTETPLRQWQWDTGLYMIPPGHWRTETPRS
jgi:peptidoglycan hydrolase-like protein with peptidoglycan-binding domain